MARLFFPGMGFIENGLAAASEALDEKSLQLFDITFDRPLVLHAHEHWDLQAQVTREGRGRAGASLQSGRRLRGRMGAPLFYERPAPLTP